jgi:heme oxygenase
MRAAQRLDDETRTVRADVEAEAASLLAASTAAEYQTYLTRAYGFLAPLERCLLDTSGLEVFLDARRLRKHLLIEHDLQTLGMRTLEVQSIPQCMWIPWFDNPWTALGWAYLVEHSTLSFPTLFRHVASALPGEAAFAATYLKVYSASSDMWRSFCEGVELASRTPENLEQVVAGAQSAYRHFRRWRGLLDGKSLSSPPRDTAAMPALSKPATPQSDVEES